MRSLFLSLIKNIWRKATQPGKVASSLVTSGNQALLNFVLPSLTHGFHLNILKWQLWCQPFHLQETGRRRTRAKWRSLLPHPRTPFQHENAICRPGLFPRSLLLREGDRILSRHQQSPKLFSHSLAEGSGMANRLPAATNAGSAQSRIIWRND